MSSNESSVVEVKSPGFELYLPPTPLHNPRTKPPGRARFVMLDDINDVFYDVDYETPSLGNTISWVALELHKVREPAIVFRPTKHDLLNDPKRGFAIGLLVSIESREQDIISARYIGSVNVRVLERELMNWAALGGLKGEELPAEMRAGLLRRVWDKGKSAATQSIHYVTPKDVLDKMPRPWHLDGVALNYELDQQFGGATAIGPQQLWRLHSGKSQHQIGSEG